MTLEERVNKIWPGLDKKTLAATIRIIATEERERLCAWLSKQSSHGRFFADEIRAGNAKALIGE